MRPRYLTVKTPPVGLERTSVVVTYPADWLAVAYDSDEISDSPAVRLITLRRREPSGLQRWLEAVQARANRQQPDSGVISVLLQAIPDRRAVQLDHEAERLASTARQLADRRGAYSIRKLSYPAGDGLDVRIDSRRTTSRDWSDRWMVLFPRAKPGMTQYEVIVRCTVPRSEYGRLARVADDVVSHLRLVQDVGKQSP